MKSFNQTKVQCGNLSDSSFQSNQSEEFQSLETDLQVNKKNLFNSDSTYKTQDKQDAQLSAKKYESLKTKEDSSIRDSQNKQTIQSIKYTEIQSDNERIRETFEKLEQELAQCICQKNQIKEKYEQSEKENKELKQKLYNLQAQQTKFTAVIKKLDQEIGVAQNEKKNLRDYLYKSLKILGVIEQISLEELSGWMREKQRQINRFFSKINSIQQSICDKKNIGVKPNTTSHKYNFEHFIEKLSNIESQMFTMQKTTIAHRSYIIKLEKQLDQVKKTGQNEGLKKIFDPVFKFWRNQQAQQQVKPLPKTTKKPTPKK